MKTIKYILKRVIVAILIFIIISFLRSCNVNALTTNGTKYSSPVNATFYANPSASYHIVSPATFNPSYGSYSSGVINGLGGPNDIYGADVCIALDGPLKGGYIYSLSIILNNGTNNIYTIPNGDNYTMLRAGADFNTAINGVGTVQINYFGTAFTPNVTDNWQNGASVLSYLFIPKAQYDFICLPFKTTTNTSLIHSLLGYNIEVVGNSAGLSADTVNSIVNNAIASTDNKIMGIYTSLEGIEQNLSRQNQNIKTEIQVQMDQIEDTMKDDTTDDPDGKINEASSKVATDNVISQLVLLPVTLFTKVLASLNSSCVNYNLGELYGHNLTMPCINIQNYLGGFLWNTIDVLISGLLIYAISRKFVKVFNELSQMKEGDIID